MPRYTSDGTTMRKVKYRYTTDGTITRKVKERYSYDGTTSRKVYASSVIVKNLFTNGDITGSATGWILANGAFYIATNDNGIYCANNQTWQQAYQVVQFLATHIYYFEVTYTNIGTAEYSYNVGSIGSYNSTTGLLSLPASNFAGIYNTSKRFSGINGSQGVYVGDVYSYSLHPTCVVMNCTLVDLTDCFGAGKEPDLAWCNANLIKMGQTKQINL